MKNVINIVNFIRGWDSRASWNLAEPVREQVKLAEKYPELPITFLYQYDALIQPEFVELTRNCKAKTEIGIWIEMSKPLIEAVGMKWRGRKELEWDWYSGVDMTVGYTIEERKCIIDEIMRLFKEIYGYYPKTVGSWVLDAPSVQYMEEKYGIDAALICKEQWGTDGYSLWGGYYSGGYYPCKNNILCPAKSMDEQINTPVFRMLGCDPIDQYMSGIGKERQAVESMEPVYEDSGADSDWVKWFLKETFKNENHGVNYCQVGQENSFGWKRMGDGYTMQMALFEEKRKAGEIEFELVRETGKHFKEQYRQTPCTTVDAHKENSSTFWYNSKCYRSSLYVQNHKLLLRDIQIFNEAYKERYFNAVAVGRDCFLDNLPLVDTFKWSTTEDIGGGYFVKDGKTVDAINDFTVDCSEDDMLSAKIPTADGTVEIVCTENKMSFSFPCAGYRLDMLTYHIASSAYAFENGKIKCRYENFDYEVTLNDAKCEILENGYRIVPNDRKLELIFS